MQKKILLFIIIIAAFLRLYRLNEVPPGVNRDEASIGYTAYSLMMTGKDEYGRSWPLSFESFGDWKLPLYIYTTIPFVKVFGLNELAVRLPSALAGIASVAALYFLVLELFPTKIQSSKLKGQIPASPAGRKPKAQSSTSLDFGLDLSFGFWHLTFREIVALLSAFILAIMPWHIHISRVESEAIVATLFVIIGSILFFRKKLLLSAVFFAATYWTYHGTHVSTTLLLIGIALIYWKDILKTRQWWIATGVGALLVAGILSVTFSADRTKLGGISIFGDPAVVHAKIELPRLATGHPDQFLTRLRYNRVSFAITTVLGNYLKSYGPEFLFIKGGGNSAHNIKGYGNLHPIEAPLLILGVIWLIKNRKQKHARFLMWWIAIAAVAPAITKDAPHSNRMLMVVPALAVTTGIGISILVRKKWIGVILVLGYLISMMIYGNRYFIDFPKNEIGNWGYEFKQITRELVSSGKRVIMDKPETSPYIFLLFYSGYDPAKYQKEVVRYPISPDGFTDVAGFGNFEFRTIDWQKDLHAPNTRIVTRTSRGYFITYE